MQNLKDHTLYDYNTEDIVVICGDSIVAHCCAATIKTYYSKCDKDSDKINVLCVPNLSHVELDYVKNKKLVYFIGVYPGNDVKKYCAENKVRRVLITQDTEYATSMNKKANSVVLTSEDMRLCTVVWEYFFSNNCLKVPTCVTYIDDYMTGVARERGMCFYYGMSLMETCPDKSQGFWESLFDCRENLSSDATEEEVMERMKWDAMLQVTNMGSIVKAYITIFTERACDYAITIDDRVYVNIRECSHEVLYEEFPDEDYIVTFYVCGMLEEDNTNKVLFEYSVHSNKEDANALDFARKYGGSGSKYKATFLSTLNPEQIGL